MCSSVEVRKIQYFMAESLKRKRKGKIRILFMLNIAYIHFLKCLVKFRECACI